MSHFPRRLVYPVPEFGTVQGGIAIFCPDAGFCTGFHAISLGTIRRITRRQQVFLRTIRSKQALVFPHGAAVFDDGHTGFAGDFPCLFTGDAGLHPQDLGADGDSLACDFRKEFRAAEAIDHIDTDIFRDGFQRRVAGLAESLRE